MKKKIVCEDNNEAQKLASLIYVKDNNEIFITGILQIIENELIISLKDKSAHSILLRDKVEEESFADFIQSVIERINKITKTDVFENVVEITKEKDHTSDLSISLLTISCTFKKYNLVVYGMPSRLFSIAIIRYLTARFDMSKLNFR